MKKYYLQNENESIGPFSKDELKEQKITKETLVWTGDLPDWIPAGQVDELKAVLLCIPPPIKNKTSESITKPRKRGYIKYLFLVAIIIVAITIVSNTIPDESGGTINSDDDTARLIRNQITDLVQIKTNKYTVDGWGGISNLDVIAYNQTDYMINQITVAVAYIKENGGTFKTELITFYNIPPHQDKSLSAPDSNRGLSVNLITQKIESQQLQLCYDSNNTSAVGDPDPYKCQNE